MFILAVKRSFFSFFFILHYFNLSDEGQNPQFCARIYSKVHLKFFQSFFNRIPVQCFHLLCVMEFRTKKTNFGRLICITQAAEASCKPVFKLHRCNIPTQGPNAGMEGRAGAVQ